MARFLPPMPELASEPRGKAACPEKNGKMQAQWDARLQACLRPLEARITELEKKVARRAMNKPEDDDEKVCLRTPRHKPSYLDQATRQEPLPLEPPTESKKSEETEDLAANADGDSAHEAGITVDDMIEERGISGSTWECVIVWGLPFIGQAGSFVLLFTLFVNVILQLGFCWIALQSEFTEDTLLSPTAARRWRLTDAHSISYMDRSSFISLADRVCANDPSLIFGNTQASVYSEIQEYSDTRIGFNVVSAGQLLCTLVLIVWTLYIIQEVQDTVAFMSSLYALPRDVVSRLSVSGDAFVFETLSARRLFFAAAVSAFRIIVAIALYYTGCYWLCMTRGLTDLVLNAAALACVLDVDELIYGTLTPVGVRSLVERLEALKVPPGHRWRGLGWQSVMGIFLAIFGPLIFLAAVARPMQTKMADVTFEMCGRGETDFVVDGNNHLGHAVMVRTNSAHNGDSPVEIESWFKHAVEDFITKGYVPEPQPRDGVCYYCSTAVMAWGSTSFWGELDKTVTASSSSIVVCEDFIHVRSLAASVSFLSYTYDIEGGLDCTMYASHCNDIEATALRFICPRTCGCGDPWYGLYYLDGCPDICFTERDSRISTAPCVDVNNESDPIMFAGIDRMMEQFQMNMPGQFPEGFRGTCDDIAGLAADVTYSWLRRPLCSASSARAFGSMKPFCPAICLCPSIQVGSSDGLYQCPQICSSDGAGAVAVPPSVGVIGCSWGICLNGSTVREDTIAFEDAPETCEFFNNFFRAKALDDPTCHYMRFGGLPETCCRCELCPPNRNLITANIVHGNYTCQDLATEQDTEAVPFQEFGDCAMIQQACCSSS